MSPVISIPVIPQDINQWARKAAAAINELAAENTATVFTWNKGCVTVPTSTTISGAEEIFFESTFTGNGTLVITIFDAEGGVNVALNGVELGALSGTASQEVLYEVPVTNLVEGDDPLNVFKIWSTSADTAELRKLEVYRNFAREQISDSAIWGNITSKPEDSYNLWIDPLFDLTTGDWESTDPLHSIVADPLGTPIYDNAVKMDADSTNNTSDLITVPAKEDDAIYMDFDILKDGSVNSGADAGVFISWRDVANTQISSDTNFQDESGMSTSAWTKFSSTLGPAPAGTIKAIIRISNRTTHTAGSFYLTNLRALRNALGATDNSDALTGQLILDGATIEQSSGGAARIITQGMASGVAFDGDAFTFDPARDAVPTIVWGAGGKTESSALTPPTWKDFQAQNLTTSGFTAFLKISEIAGSLTSRTETGATTGGTFDFEMNKDETADEAFDDNYTYQIDVSVSAAVGGGEPEPSTVTVAYLADSGAGFVEKATKVFVNNTGSTKTFLNNLQTINQDGMGLNDDWAVNVKSTFGNGGSITAFDNVTYESGSGAPAVESATPTGVSGINFEIKSGEEGSVT